MKRQAQDFTGKVVAYLEDAFGAQAQGGNQRVGSKFALVIGMPADRVIAVAIEVGQQTVERGSTKSFDMVFQCEQGLIPGQRVMSRAGIAIFGLRMPVPSREPGRPDTATRNEQRFFLPLEIPHQFR